MKDTSTRACTEILPYAVRHEGLVDPCYGDTPEEATSNFLEQWGSLLRAEHSYHLREDDVQVELTLLTRPKVCHGWKGSSTCGCGEPDKHEPHYSQDGQPIGLPRLVGYLSESPFTARIQQDA
jgi:hypothetical protein